MPGVNVLTATRPGPGSLVTAPSSTFFVAGITERGRTDEAILVRSMAEATELLGERVTYGSVHDALACYFGEGGQRAYVARTVGGAATVGTLTLEDTAGVAVDTLRIDALGPGAWSANITVQVSAGAAANTFRLTIRYAGQIVEVFDNLANPAAAVQALLASGYVRAVDLASPTVAPANNPAVLAATALTAGADDRAAVVAATLIAALARFTPDLGPGAVAIPGQPASAVGAALIAHARANRRLALLADATGVSAATAKASAAALRGSAGSENAGFFYPWVLIPDGAGATRPVSPEGYVAGVRARAQLAEGPWRAPAGEIAAARYVIGTDAAVDRATGDDLNEAGISAIRVIAGGPRLYGWRSLSTDDVNFRLLTGADVLNDVASLAERALETFVFATIDGRGHTFARVAATLTGLVDPYRAAGGLYERLDPETGQAIDAGYSVDAGLEANTVESLARNELRANLGLRVSPTGELVRLTVTKVALAESL